MSALLLFCVLPVFPALCGSVRASVLSALLSVVFALLGTLPLPERAEKAVRILCLPLLAACFGGMALLFRAGGQSTALLFCAVPVCFLAGLGGRAVARAGQVLFWPAALCAGIVCFHALSGGLPPPRLTGNAWFIPLGPAVCYLCAALASDALPLGIRLRGTLCCALAGAAVALPLWCIPGSARDLFLSFGMVLAGSAPAAYFSAVRHNHKLPRKSRPKAKEKS